MLQGSFVFILLLLSLVHFAPSAFAANSEKVQALKEFDFVVKKIENNYAGFRDKVTAKNRAEYQRFTRKKRSEIQQTHNPAEIIREWLEFFQDKHVGYSEASGSPNQVDSSAYQTLKGLNEASFKDQLTAKGKAVTPWEGLWIESDNDYTIAVLPNETDPDEYLGVVTSSALSGWQAGQIKFKISRENSSAIYYKRDHSSSKEEAVFLADHSLLKIGSSYFRKTFPAPSKSLDLETVVPQNRTFMKKLSEKTLYVRIPAFPIEVRAELRKLFDEFATELKSTDNLIIDVRSNLGGDTRAYAELMKYLYTRPVYSFGAETLSTPDNIAMLEKILKLPENTREEVNDIGMAIRKLKAAPGKFVSWDRQFSITTYPEILPNPQRVGILINGAASTGESFVFDARQSHKVTLFGQATLGCVDYVNVNELPTPRGNSINYPIGRSFRLPEESVDVKGIPPDIYIPESDYDPVSKIQKWLEKQVKPSDF